MNKLKLLKINNKNEVTITEVDVEKETKKQYRVNGCIRSVVNKAELNINVGCGDIQVFFIEGELKDVIDRLVDIEQRNLESITIKAERARSRIDTLKNISME